MSPAHLHAVPDPEFCPDEVPDPGEWPVPVAGVVAPLTAAADDDQDDDQLENPPADEDDEQGLADDEDQEDDDEDQEDDEEDQEDDEEAGEYPGLLRSLLPYCDPRPLAELGPLAVEVGRVGGPPLLRALGRLFHAIGRFFAETGRMLCWYGRGILVLLIILTGWLSGSIGKRGSVGARLAGAGFALYAVAKTCTQFPAAPWITLAVALAAVVMASMGHITVPVSKPAKKAGAKKGEGGKKTTAKSKAALTEKEMEEAAEVTKEDAPAEPRRGLLGFLAGRSENAPAEPSPEGPEEGDDEADGDAPEDDEEEVPEPPEEDPLTTLLRAAIGDENGVHLGVLRPLMRKALPALSRATDKELRQHLISAGYDPSRTFRARGVAGRAGVHRSELPPLPSPGSTPGALSGPLSSPGERPRPAKISASGEQRRAAGEGSERGYTWVEDPTKPNAWKIEYDPAD
ncbi:hypothetical protein [Streptomyces sp. A1136]|uniref:hypothetical protein n=1 Tax=Streptomyces sp. A1136 TaxID=2563102 RepID=UPI001448246D|nr:hypothetical protein [Streptomyces sp. A1136]